MLAVDNAAGTEDPQLEFLAFGFSLSFLFCYCSVRPGVLLSFRLVHLRTGQFLTTIFKITATFSFSILLAAEPISH